jgi:hypothetical protein
MWGSLRGCRERRDLTRHLDRHWNAIEVFRDSRSGACVLDEHRHLGASIVEPTDCGAKQVTVAHQAPGVPSLSRQGGAQVIVPTNSR